MSEAGTAGDSPFAAILAPMIAGLAAPLRHQYLLSPVDGHCVCLRGRMTRVWHRPRWIGPALGLLALAGLLFPETGHDVPAQMTVTAELTPDGRARQVWRRTFCFWRRRRRFVSAFVHDARRGTVVERVGPGELVRIPWRLQVRDGDLRIGTVRMYLGPLPLPRCLTGEVLATERAVGPCAIDVTLIVRHPFLGPVFGYEGRFEVRREPLA
jgi:Domain of unknown function (DUF4166)